jgi:hypothetical protein
VPNPLPGVASALVICGSDKRGTIYGIYDLSEQIGVSPWHYWADVPAKHHDQLFVKAGKFVQGPPSVRYRGMFLNDEAPDLTGWVKEKFGTVPGHPGVANYGRGFYTNLFELSLRIRANYLGPRCGTMRSMRMTAKTRAWLTNTASSWAHRIRKRCSAHKRSGIAVCKKYGNWNYNNTNHQPVLQQFWREGISRNKVFESTITLGLRAENDSGANRQTFDRADRRRSMTDSCRGNQF